MHPSELVYLFETEIDDVMLEPGAPFIQVLLICEINACSQPYKIFMFICFLLFPWICAYANLACQS